MIRVQTPSGKKNFILRGIMTPAGKKGIAQGSILTPDGDKVFWDGALAALEVNLTPPFVQGAAASWDYVTINTGATEATASGGSEPYTYDWTVTPDAPGWTIIKGLKNALLQCSNVGPSDVRNATLHCTVTDARGATGSASANAFVQNYGGYA